MRQLLVACAVIALAATLSAQLPEAWQHWRFSGRIDTGAAAPGGLIGVPVPLSVTTRARRDWLDLRVIDAQGTEVPYVLHARVGGRTINRRPVILLEPSAVEGQYQQAIADVGEGVAIHNSLMLHLSTTQNLLSWVEIAVSSDLKDWRVVRDRAPIYALRAEGMGENTEVSYPDSASRYVRIRVLDGSGTYRLLAAELGREESTVAERVPSGVDLVASTDALGRSVWTSDGDGSALPISGVEFRTPQPAFFRAAVIESNDGGDAWQTVASGDILRAADGVRDRAWLTVAFPETHARRWRVTVQNRNDAPVADLSAVLLTTPRRVVLKPESGESYRLLYGNPRAQAPRYDLAQRIDINAMETAAPATLGAEDENPAWVDPSPWTERYDTVLWVALGLAVVTLGVVAVRTLRSTTT